MVSSNLIQAKNLLKNVLQVSLTDEERIAKSIQLAALIQLEANQGQTFREKLFSSELSRMMQDEKGKIFTTELTDAAFRSQDPHRVASQINYVIGRYGVPKYLLGFKKWGLKIFQYLGETLPSIFVPLTKLSIRMETSRVMIPGEPSVLIKHLKTRMAQGVRVNLNHLGEAILGEEEATKRLNTYLEDLARPEVEYISVKISTLFSQINLLDQEGTIKILSERFQTLLIESQKHFFVRKDGKAVPKFINLDMEEYKDLHLTVALFKEVLTLPQFREVSVGIVLQSYLPDSFAIQKDLTEFAQKRVSKGGAPIKIRLVKGANLAMEKVEASLRCWKLAPYEEKAFVDANFKRMVHFAFDQSRTNAVNIGIGSHNLFDISYALILSQEKGVSSKVSFEMLEGMAEPSRRVIKDLASDMLLYCPAATREEFQNAVAYLIRRLDENTGPENFLRVSFGLIPETRAWQHQADFFAQSVLNRENVSLLPSRDQDRNQEPKYRVINTFVNEPDTDFSLLSNQKWAENILKKNIKSFPSERYLDLLSGIAHELRLSRATLISAMMENVGKTLIEADVEVSEAIDFAEYYRHVFLNMEQMQAVSMHPKGTILILAPWNFPCSIPAGGILASLATGNRVIFKPAPEAELVGAELVKAFYRAGVLEDRLKFCPCSDEEAGLLVQDQSVDAVVLTGASATAEMLYGIRQGLDLMAETGGKNTLIVTAMADRDLAVKDAVQSAFGFSGQKCSALSLLILEAEVYDDPAFRRQLLDAVKSLPCGMPSDFKVKIGPLINPPEGALNRAIESLENGEEWLLKPKIDPDNPRILSPGIKIGVKPDSATFQEELFGPILAVVKAKNLEDAIHIANSTRYGLTAGLHSLDPREHEVWLKGIKAGNYYINRGITGAIVERQPFGGVKASSFGPGAKAGGPNYLFQFMHIEPKKGPLEKAPFSHKVRDLIEAVSLSEDELKWVQDAAGSYQFCWNDFFSKDHDPANILGQRNIQRYVPRDSIDLRVLPSDRKGDVVCFVIACLITGSSFTISLDESCDGSYLNLPFPTCKESDETFLERISKKPYNRIRLFSDPPAKIRQGLSKLSCWQQPLPLVAQGRVELLRYLQEVSISYDYHRYGNV